MVVNGADERLKDFRRAAFSCQCNKNMVKMVRKRIAEWEQKEESMRFMKRLVFGSLVFLMGVSVAWAGERGHQLVIGRDSKVCAKVLMAFRDDVDDRGRQRYQHEMFQQIIWKQVDLRGQAPKTRHCSSLDKAIFDVDNDGQSDLVIKTTFCMKGSASDSFYVFPADSAVLDQSNWQDLAPLLATPDKFERTGGIYPLAQLHAEETGVSSPSLTGVFTVYPFMLDGNAYVSLTDGRAEWTVIAKYRRGERFEDQCYFQRAST
jgi:hypothetical protein